MHVIAQPQIRELARPAAEWRAEFLRFRARFIEQSRGARAGVELPSDFAFGKYLQLTAAADLKQTVSVEPLQLVMVWAPLIGACRSLADN